MGRLVSSGSLDLGAFPPGAILGERYRIVGLLGRGGMGEVYRADDLKLGQAVALKFLPKAVSNDEALLARFHAEVRLARQVSHPNVCRIYDIGEIEGRHFLSMEYVDGEDLASLLKRIGHLPVEKAVEIARQLCAGLHAAHEKGVLHRDLKPANVMLDGRGRVRITDFGLAVAAEEAANVGEVSGTPAYMAPEQLAGKPASVRSDLYALGLVLYEVATGKRAFDAPTLAEMRRKHEQEPPAAPSNVLAGFDPAVERVILRCLEKDPRARPSSAVQVAGSLARRRPARRRARSRRDAFARDGGGRGARRRHLDREVRGASRRRSRTPHCHLRPLALGHRPRPLAASEAARCPRGAGAGGDPPARLHGGARGLERHFRA